MTDVLFTEALMRESNVLTAPHEPTAARSSPRMPMECRTARRCGALAGPDDTIRWRVWAPQAKQVDLLLFDGDERRVCPMTRDERGHFSHTEHDLPDGQRYAFRLDGGADRPDPCSLWQPDGVHGPSAVVRPDRFAWT